MVMDVANGPALAPARSRSLRNEAPPRDCKNAMGARWPEGLDCDERDGPKAKPPPRARRRNKSQPKTTTRSEVIIFT